MLCCLQLYQCCWNLILVFLCLTRLVSDSVESLLPLTLACICFLSLAHLPELTLPISACTLPILYLPSMPASDHLLPTWLVQPSILCLFCSACTCLVPAACCHQPGNLLACQNLPFNHVVQPGDTSTTRKTIQASIHHHALVATGWSLSRVVQEAFPLHVRLSRQVCERSLEVSRLGSQHS